ncbi:MAG: UDP-N-acetylmuramate dehydrogenase [Acidobacteria bacterium]|nr:UDP-N-acetylmuramate dehydrogenase [Acidobacteriota bacterium]
MTSSLKVLQQELANAFGKDRVRVNEPLAKHCNWKAGGPADLFLIVRTTDELVQALRFSQQHHQPATVLGFGANALVSDRGIRGLVVLNRAERILFHPDCLVEADSGTNLAVLAKRAAEQGVGGLEFLIGIPGTVGAAVAGNAGTRERWIETVLEHVRVFGTNGQEYELWKSELDFSYRNSRIKHTGEIVITAWLRGQPEERCRIERNMDALLRQRKNQPPGPSAGSVFKNPPGDFAGRLIEQCGLKGYQIGGAKISEMHANFIVNLGGASAADIKALIDRAKAEVEHRFGVRLEEEIRYLGDWL